MSSLNRVFEALLAYDEAMQKVKEASDQIRKADVEMERQNFYSYIAGYAAGRAG